MLACSLTFVSSSSLQLPVSHAIAYTHESSDSPYDHSVIAVGRSSFTCQLVVCNSSPLAGNAAAHGISKMATLCEQPARPSDVVRPGGLLNERVGSKRNAACQHQPTKSPKDAWLSLSLGCDGGGVVVMICLWQAGQSRIMRSSHTSTTHRAAPLPGMFGGVLFVLKYSVRWC